MARTRIRNISGVPASLPLPYSGTIPAGGGVIVSDSISNVAANLGTAAGAVFSVEAVPEGNPAVTAIPTGTITSSDLAPGAVSDTSKVADNAIATADITDLAVTTGKINDLAVTTGKIAALAVEEGKIGALAVTAGKIGALAVEEAKINALAVTEGKIGALAVTAGKIGALAVEEAKINALAVTEGKIGALAVTEAKIGALAVTEGKIGAAAVTSVKLGIVESAGIGPKLVIRKTFTAGTPGSADDVVIYNANAPFAFRVLDSQLLLVTAVMSATAQLRDALAGSGNVVSGSFDTATAVGRVRDAGTAITAAPLIALGGTLALRRSDIGIAGEVIVEILKV
jgi:hypothetical protein